MAKPLTHPNTERQLQDYLARPTHALGIFGSAGSGVNGVAHWLATQILNIPLDSFEQHPYTMLIAPVDGKAIGIEAIRSIEQFVQLKVPGNAAFNRVIIIEGAHLLGGEAQNALLKTLEEPPQGTLLLLTAEREDALLTTIQSRLQAISVKTPTKQALLEHFAEQGHEATEINRVYAMTGGLPELMSALLTGTDHPLVKATEAARQLVAGTTYQRLTQVDSLSKQKDLARDALFILQQMAHIRLQTAQGDASKQWQRVLTASYNAAEALDNSGQPKLVLTDLMLHL